MTATNKAGKGYGKSTLARPSIPRFYDVNGGRVLVAGGDAGSCGSRSCAGKIGYVRRKRVLSRARSRQSASARAGDRRRSPACGGGGGRRPIHDQMPEGTGRRGRRVAPILGRQKQRLAIARALAGARHLLWDATAVSALDIATNQHRLRRALGPTSPPTSS